MHQVGGPQRKNPGDKPNRTSQGKNPKEEPKERTQRWQLVQDSPRLCAFKEGRRLLGALTCRAADHDELPDVPTLAEAGGPAIKTQRLHLDFVDRPRLKIGV